jgi:hypothetical protein
MTKIEPIYRKVFIIGNGFDLNLGLKTKYIDFINSNQFEKLLAQRNSFSLLLKERSTNLRWIDAEKELKNFANNYSKNINQDDFKVLCECLLEYMHSQNLENNYESTKAYKVIKETCDKDYVILDFNYTDSVEKILASLGTSESSIIENIIKVHGSVKERSIVFGIEDEAKVNPNHLYLQKSYNKNYKGVNLNNLWKAVSEIHIFGHSLGETDHPYFNEFFIQAAIGNFQRIGLKLFIYYYGEESYKDLMTQINTMTQNQIRNLRQNIHFVPIDIYDEALK